MIKTTKIPTLLVAKFVRQLVRLRGGSGSALPGYLVEKVDKTFLPEMLTQLPLGVVVVTGTNGKTTTTRMLVELLRQNELRVLTNESGSNLTRGLISTAIERSKLNGRLPYDIAVFELDEAYAPKFTAMISPKLLIALNVMRDQLDRYGELDTTANFIAKAAASAQTVIINGSDPLLMQKIVSKTPLLTFGLAPAIQGELSSETNLFSKKRSIQQAESFTATIHEIKTADHNQKFTATINSELISCTLPLLGTHNAQNALVAILATKVILPQVDTANTASQLREYQPAFGRGESMTVLGRELTVALIKNPSGFTQNVATFVRSGIDAVLIVINDEYADGRDVSWLWDSNIEKLKLFRGHIFVGGTRRYDMALCLKYQGIACEVVDAEKPDQLMKNVLHSSKWHEHLLIIPTYTAMLSIRKWLAHKQGVKRIW